MSQSKINRVPFIDPRINLTDCDNIIEIIKENDKIKCAKCLVKNCGLDIHADSEGNLKKFNILRHLKRQHIKEYEEIVDKINKKSSEISRTTEHKQTILKNFFQSTNLKITIDKNTFEEGIVEMVCFDSCPLKLFCGKGFHKIGGEIAKKLGLSQNYESVRQLIISYAEAARNTVKEELKSNLLYLKMDAATRGYRNFLAVNVQFYDKAQNKLQIKMLDIIDTKNQHGSEYIKNTVKGILQKFDIEETQVLSICVDNANNMVCAVRKFSESVSEEKEEEGEEEEENPALSSNDYELIEEWVSDPKLILPEWIFDCDVEVQVMRCAVHTLQLAVWAGLNNKEAEIQLKRIRTAVIKLRTRQVRTILLKRFHLTQSIDVITRWGSTYLMIKRFLKFKSFCEEAAATGTKELLFTSSEWKNIENLCELLAKAYATTIHLQSADLTAGVFLKLKTDSISSTDDEFEKLLDCQEKRKRYHALQLSNLDLLKKNFEDECDLIEAIGRIKVGNVFEAINKYPEKIQQACKIASCMPSTQVSVERLFSSVKIILSDLRNSIKEDLLSAILFNRNNK